MQKLIAKILATLMIFGGILNDGFELKTAAASEHTPVFSDLFLSHPNYEAITYLAENNVLNGYPDETFRPNNDVNRAEFLKIIIEGSKITSDITEATPFPDVDHSAWYGKYVQKAYKEGWINGYPDGTFKPAQTINKVEALKILGKAQSWPVPITIESLPFTDTPTGVWYSPFIQVAVENNYLEENGTLFQPSGLMTRAKISEIIYRTIINGLPEENQQDPEPTEDTDSPDEEQIDESVNPVLPKNIATNFFEKIILNSTLPNIFYKNEVYLVEGKVSDSSYKKVTAILQGTNNGFYKTFSSDVINGNFSIPINFQNGGNYNLGILAGDSGTTKATPIVVMTTLPSSTTQENPTQITTNPNISFSNDQTKITFTSPDSTIKKINLIQNSEKVTYITRQNTNHLVLNYADFENFTKANVSFNIETATISSSHPIEITSAFQAGETQNFSATQHEFSEILINAAPPETFTSPQTIQFSGTTNINIFQKAYVIKPNGFVENVTLESNSTKGTFLNQTTILAEGSFTYSYTPNELGTYILEINDSEGKPVLNHALYIGSSTPLIPDYFDLYERELFTGTFDLTQQRNSMLKLINQARTAHGLSAITMKDDLNNLAQGHAENMAENNFFSHVNPEGQTPDDRRLAEGIATSVSENLAKDVSVEQAHYGLMRSASHRDNILTPEWTTVGIGIAHKDGLLHITQEFSTNPITAADIVQFTTQLYQEINNKRAESGLTALNIKPSIEDASKFLVDKQIQENSELTQELFTSALETYNIFGSSTAVGRSFNIWNDLLDSLLTEESTSLNSTWKSMGANIQVDARGIIHLLLILNNQS